MSLWVLLLVAAIACILHVVVRARRVKSEAAYVQAGADERLAKAVHVLQRSQASVTLAVQHQPLRERGDAASRITTRQATKRAGAVIVARPAMAAWEQLATT